MFELYADLDENASQILGLAHQEMEQYGHRLIATEHLLVALVQTPHFTAIIAREMTWRSMRDLRGTISEVYRGVAFREAAPRNPPTTVGLDAVIEAARRESRDRGLSKVTPELLLFVLTRRNNNTAATILADSRVQLHEIARDLLSA